MTGTLKISLAIVILAVCAVWAQSSAPPLQQGIRVSMAPTEHAQPVPEADDSKAWVVTITRDSKVFFRANQTTPEELLEFLKAQPRDRDAKFYIKADALVPFANVRRIFNEAEVLRFETAVLLTSQPTPPSASGPVPPMGLAVQVAGALNSDAIPVQIIKTNRYVPEMKINNQQVPASAFPGALSIVLQTQKDKTVLVRGDGQLPFSQVVQFMDTCRAAGATLAMSGTDK